jgi:predicted GIY-YIG superfamily endonuclease
MGNIFGKKESIIINPDKICIYVLRLTNNKYYIGKSANILERIEDHIDGNGAAWTNKYKPIQILDIIPNCDIEDENKYTLRYMKEKGINNVRGGSFCQIELEKENIITIKKMICDSDNACYYCKKEGHFISDCPEKIKKQNKCFRCGRTGHFIANCYAKTHIKGYILK